MPQHHTGDGEHLRSRCNWLHALDQ
jgi:hypothetical protein